MFYVIVIDSDGIPGSLYGPLEWDQCIEKIKSLLAGKKPITLTKEELNLLENEGSYMFKKGGGIYTICAE